MLKFEWGYVFLVWFKVMFNLELFGKNNWELLFMIDFFVRYVGLVMDRDNVLFWLIRVYGCFEDIGFSWKGVV